MKKIIFKEKKNGTNSTQTYAIQSQMIYVERWKKERQKKQQQQQQVKKKKNCDTERGRTQ